MNEHSELGPADLIEIQGLAARVQRIIGRRRFMSAAAKTVAFTVPASMVTGIPSDALAQGSGGTVIMRKKAKRKAKKKAKKKAAR